MKRPAGIAPASRAWRARALLIELRPREADRGEKRPAGIAPASRAWQARALLIERRPHVDWRHRELHPELGLAMAA